MTINNLPQPVPADSGRRFKQPGKKRKLWPFLVGGFVLLGLIGSCNGIGDGKQDQTSPVKTTQPTVKAAAVPDPTLPPAVENPVDTEAPSPELSDDMKDTLFLSMVRDSVPEAAGVPDDTLTSLAHDTCSAFDAGHTAQQIVETLYLSSGNQQANIAVVTGMGIGVYCPEYLDELGTGF